MIRLSRREVVQYGGMVTAVVTVAAGSLWSPPVTSDPDAQLVLAIFLATVILWVIRPIPYAVSSVACMVLLYASGTTDSFADAASGFSSTLIFFIILLLLVGQAIANVGLAEWISGRIVRSAGSAKRTVYRMAGVLLALAVILPSGLARTAAFMPVIDQINDAYRFDRKSRFRRLSYAIVGHLNPMASMALMTGGGVAVITSEIVNAEVRTITWVEWAIYMLPPTVLLYTIAVLVTVQLSGISTPIGEPESTSENTQTPETLSIGGSVPLTTDQKLVLTTLVFAIAFWIVGSFTGVHSIVPALFIVLIFSLPKVRLVTSREFKEVNWGIVFIIGTMLSIVEVMRDVGSFDFVTDAIFATVPTYDSVAIMLTLFLFCAMAIRALLSSTSAAIAILIPLVLELTSTVNVDSLFVALATMMMLFSVSIVPFNRSTVLLAYEKGPLSLGEVFLFGLLLKMLSALVVIACWIWYWPLLSRVGV